MRVVEAEAWIAQCDVHARWCSEFRGESLTLCGEGNTKLGAGTRVAVSRCGQGLAL
jgi:hypothetical protein